MNRTMLRSTIGAASVIALGWATALASGPVYELLGKKGLGVKEFPPLGTKVISGDLGFHQHPGGHTSGPAWTTFYEFAAKYLNAPAKN